jgi:hypothetical protein
MDARIKSGHDECVCVRTNVNFKQRQTSKLRSHSFTISRPDMPEVCQKFPCPPKGRRECRAPDAPAAACAMIVVERTRVCQVTPESPGIPRAMVLTVSFVLSPVTGLVCHRHWRSCLRQLDTSVGVSGPHDFAVRFSAVRQEHIRVHRIPPRVRDDRDTPLSVGRNGSGYRSDLGIVKTEIFLREGLDTKIAEEPVGQISGVSAPEITGDGLHRDGSTRH